MDNKKRFLNDAKNPSFSSTLLDKIYRSMEEGERKSTATDTKFYTETMRRKQSRAVVEDKEFTVTSGKQRGQWKTQTDRKSRYHDHDQDVLFFSSTSSSSDSSSGLLSSSDTESMYGVRSSRVSCFLPSRPKPVRTSETHIGIINDNNNNEEGLIKSKSRALKIYNNLKKVKQPISPGGKLTSFLNSLLGNPKKTTKTTHSFEHANAERKGNPGQGSTCSSASSFSRSCLSKNSLPSSRDATKVKRTVRFYPVSVIVDEDSKPCGHKCLYEGEDTRLMSVSVPTAWKIGRSKKNEEEVVDKSKRVEEAAREFLKEYRRNQRKSDLVSRDFRNEDEDEDEDDDDAASCSSSDLFELDHLAVMGSDRYCEELPVYETTHVSTNRAIANGLLM